MFAKGKGEYLQVVSAKDTRGRTALDYDRWHGHDDVVLFLMEKDSQDFRDYYWGNA